MGELAAKRIGSVPYLNAVPLTFGIETETEFLPPSQLAKRLRSGDLAVGLVSLTEVLFHDLYDILDGVAVASDGPVKSVFVAHKKPLEELEVIQCDTASLSSLNLLKVTLARRGLSPRLEPLDDYACAAEREAVLLIGNPGHGTKSSTLAKRGGRTRACLSFTRYGRFAAINAYPALAKRYYMPGGTA